MMAITRTTNATRTVINAARCCIRATRIRRRHETDCPDARRSDESTEEEEIVVVTASPPRTVSGNRERARHRGGGRFAQVGEHEFIERDALGHPAVREL